MLDEVDKWYQATKILDNHKRNTLEEASPKRLLFFSSGCADDHLSGDLKIHDNYYVNLLVYLGV